MTENKRGFIDPVSVDDLETAAAGGELDAGSQALLDDEFGYIQARRPGATKADLVGLALSGGGIRSASFALGVMQALAGEGLLKRIDYLSTVSGGSYIGAALTWLLNRKHKDEKGNICDFGLGATNFPYTSDGKTAGTNQWRMLRFLRSHGKYLTPGNGITLASLIAVVLRGIILNLLVWLPITVAIMWQLQNIDIGFTQTFLPGFALEQQSPASTESLQLSLHSVDRDQKAVFYPPPVSILLLAFALALSLLFTVASIIYSLWSYFTSSGPQQRYRIRRYFEIGARYLLLFITVSAIVAAIPFLSNLATQGMNLPDAESGCLVILAGTVSFIAGLINGAWGFLRSQRAPPSITASVAALLLLIGFVLIAYGLADCFDQLDATWRGYLTWGGLATAFITGTFVNINYISLHRFYRDRLMESFMPTVELALAGNTGAAYEATDAYIQDLRPDNDGTAPYHLVNGNVILVDSKSKRRCVRGGDSFFFSPLYCGSAATGWRDTGGYMGGKLSLATAMAISGAAANPNTGSGGKGPTRSRVVSLLMSLMNLRLGYWANNPRSPGWWSRLPRNHFTVAAAQIFGNHTENYHLSELSDGGHFENLGLYELIRRRTNVIIASDAAADPDFAFTDLHIAMSRVQEDFGASISFDADNDPEQLIPRRNDNPGPYPRWETLAKRGFVIGAITYSDNTKGTLFYLKSTLDESANVATKTYKAANPTFPDETTADQFYSVEQFEAYRELGLALGRELATSKDMNDAIARPQSSN